MFYALFVQARSYLQNVEVTTMKDMHVVFAMCKLKDLQIDRGKAISSCVIFHESPDKEVRICTFGQLGQRTKFFQKIASFFMLFKKMLYKHNFDCKRLYRQLKRSYYNDKSSLKIPFWKPDSKNDDLQNIQ